MAAVINAPRAPMPNPHMPVFPLSPAMAKVLCRYGTNSSPSHDGADISPHLTLVSGKYSVAYTHLRMSGLTTTIPYRSAYDSMAVFTLQSDMVPSYSGSAISTLLFSPAL